LLAPQKTPLGGVFLFVFGKRATKRIAAKRIIDSNDKREHCSMFAPDSEQPDRHNVGQARHHASHHRAIAGAEYVEAGFVAA